MLTLGQVCATAAARRRQIKLAAARRAAAKRYEKRKFEKGILKLFEIARKERNSALHGNASEKARQAAAREALAFDCAKCGRHVRPSSGDKWGGGVRIGGALWCAKCAGKRFRPRTSWDGGAGFQGDSAITPPQWRH